MPLQWINLENPETGRLVTMTGTTNLRGPFLRRRRARITIEGQELGEIRSIETIDGQVSLTAAATSEHPIPAGRYRLGMHHRGKWATHVIDYAGAPVRRDPRGFIGMLGEEP